MQRSAEAYRRLGARVRAAHEAANAAFRDGLRDRDPAAYAALLKTFHEAILAALPSAEHGFVEGLASGYPRFVDAAIAFLEADPWFFRSGYEKQILIKHLKRIDLSEPQKCRLRAVVLAAIDGRDRTEFRHYCRLAIAVWNASLEAAVVERWDGEEPGRRRRADWVLVAAFHAGRLSD